MVYEPAARLGMRVATPFEFRLTEPITVLPALKATVPVGVGPLAPITAATSVTWADAPLVDEAPSAVAVGIVVTTRLMAGEALGESFASPP